ncbi:MAG: preprotein translocase subunit SecG, partial [Alphaproteobacteria bacterium]|nr:preprotein translocase subunit SecG [Alphaproteobacteria bacterium]
MTSLLTILHVLVCLFLMLTVLLQQGKGGGMGGAFGGGNAATVFGGSGASSFLKRLTAGAGTIFMATSMVLAFLASHNSSDALEKFGEQQSELARQKEAAKDNALKSQGSAGSAAQLEQGSAMAPQMSSPIETPIPAGSATAPSPLNPASGSATAASGT